MTLIEKRTIQRWPRLIVRDFELLPATVLISTAMLALATTMEMEIRIQCQITSNDNIMVMSIEDFRSERDDAGAFWEFSEV
ncbi:hypothetical protein TIFTF001_034267 [Ficus carica]|uniref:Uncharacterized protein n=1 Tax=Ficus carica TaxID=3494 RepID=A0AA88J8M1_FICCA|nr:hypothetical protein TIFTF001_034267 [Ficus carica]